MNKRNYVGATERVSNRLVESWAPNLSHGRRVGVSSTKEQEQQGLRSRCRRREVVYVPI